MSLSADSSDVFSFRENAYFYTWMQYTSNLVICLSLEGKIIAINSIAEKILHWKAEEIINKKFSALCDKAKIDSPLPEKLSNFIKSKKTLETTSHINSYMILWKLITVFNPDQKPIGLVLIGKEAVEQEQVALDFVEEKERLQKIHRAELDFLATMTEKVIGKTNKRAQTARDYLSNVRDYLENIIALMPEHIYWLDKNGIILGCNNLQAHDVGVASRREIIGKTIYDFLSKTQADIIREINQEVMESGKAKIIEEIATMADGKTLTFLSHKVPLKDQQGQVIGLLGISVDITERKKMAEDVLKAKERAEKANRAKSEFLAVMSHELRTPLNGIMGASQILMARHPRSDQKEFIEDIYRSGNILLALINDVLDLSKLEAGKLEFLTHPCDFQMIVEEMVNDLSSLAEEKGLKILSDYQENVPRYIVADSRRLRQILFNLMGNAIKYTEQGYILIRVECVRQEKKEATFRIYVIDTGIGIPDDKLDMVFDQFSQVEPFYYGHYRGTGLGLAIVKQMVESMNGTIHVKSELHKGSTFWCELTFALQDSQTPKIVWPKRYQHLKLLIVDDDALSGRALAEQLGLLNTRYVTNQEIMQALSMAKNEAHSFEALIVDDQEGRFDVLALAKQIEQEFQFNKPALFILTTRYNRKNKDRLRYLEFCKYLSKTMASSKLTELIIQVLDKRYIKLKKLSRKTLAQLKVLLVEDNLINQKISKVMLEEEDCQVDVVTRGKEALKKDLQKYDIIFMDIGLPDIDGYEVTRKIREKGIMIPIIAMTANAFEQDKHKSVEAGMDAFVSKPVEQKDLHEVLITQILKQKSHSE